MTHNTWNFKLELNLSLSDSIIQNGRICNLLLMKFSILKTFQSKLNLNMLKWKSNLFHLHKNWQTKVNHSIFTVTDKIFVKMSFWKFDISHTSFKCECRVLWETSKQRRDPKSLLSFLSSKIAWTWHCCWRVNNIKHIHWIIWMNLIEFSLIFSQTQCRNFQNSITSFRILGRIYPRTVDMFVYKRNAESKSNFVLWTFESTSWSIVNWIYWTSHSCWQFTTKLNHLSLWWQIHNSSFVVLFINNFFQTLSEMETNSL